jgi:integrase
MKQTRFTPTKTPKGWRLNIPANLSTTGTRQRLFFKSKDEAERHAMPLRKNFREGEARQGILPPALSRVAERAFKALGNRPPEELVFAARAWIEAKHIEARSKTFTEACNEFRATRAHRTKKYLADFDRFNRRFPKLASRLMAQITSAEIEAQLTGIPPSAKNAILGRMSALFNFSIKRGWCLSNPIEKIEKDFIKPPPIHLISARHLRRVFVKAIRLHPELVPMLAVEAFAGVRPAEAAKVRWDDLDLEDNILTIRGEVSKTRRPRHITLHPTCRAWLDWAKANAKPEEKSPARKEPKRKKTKEQEAKQQEAERKKAELKKRLCPHPEMTLRRYLRQIREAAGIKNWLQDCLRHTFASAALSAGWRDIGGVCLDLGHSDQSMLFRHYHRALRRGPAEAVFAVLPPKKIRKPKKAKSAAN